MCLLSSPKNPHESPLRKIGDFDLKIVTQNGLTAVFRGKDINHKLSEFIKNTLNKLILITLFQNFWTIKPNMVSTAPASFIIVQHKIS